jgi:hypothetical protein
MTPIETAVAPLKNQAVEAAEVYARHMISKVREDLEANDWDINKAAPYPSYRSYGRDYETAKAKYNRYHSLTKEDPSKGYQVNNGHSPVIVVIDEDRIERFVQSYREMAAAQYEAFVAKLVSKVGEHTAATLETPSGVWDYSYVNVTTPNGEVDRWKTQCIGKYSKNGKYFHQWPTRKLVKGSKR